MVVCLLFHHGVFEPSLHPPQPHCCYYSHSPPLTASAMIVVSEELVALVSVESHPV